MVYILRFYCLGIGGDELKPWIKGKMTGRTCRIWQVEPNISAGPSATTETKANMYGPIGRIPGEVLSGNY